MNWFKRLLNPAPAAVPKPTKWNELEQAILDDIMLNPGHWQLSQITEPPDGAARIRCFNQNKQVVTKVSLSEFDPPCQPFQELGVAVSNRFRNEFTTWARREFMKQFDQRTAEAEARAVLQMKRAFRVE